MRAQHLLIIPLFVSLLLGSGCTKVISPPGYEELKATHKPQTLHASPFKPYGIMPSSYDLPDKRQLKIKVEHYHQTSGQGDSRVHMRYEVTLSDRAIKCETHPQGPHTPAARFGCWSLDAQEPLMMWIASGSSCQSQDISASQTLLRPECWQGVITTSKQRYNIELGRLDGVNSPVHYVSWTDADGTAAQAANLVAELQVELWQTTTVALDRDEQDRLILSAMALHYWLHAQNPS